jgi:hypothetical protein
VRFHFGATIHEEIGISLENQVVPTHQYFVLMLQSDEVMRISLVTSGDFKTIQSCSVNRIFSGMFIQTCCVVSVAIDFLNLIVI